MGLYLSIHAARPGEDLERDNFLVFNAPNPGGGLHSSYVSTIFGDAPNLRPRWLRECYSTVTGGPLRREHFFPPDEVLRDLDRATEQMLASPQSYPRYRSNLLRVGSVPRQEGAPGEVGLYEFIRWEWLRLHESCAWAKQNDCLVFPTFG